MIDPAIQKIIGVIDLTSLGDNDTPEQIDALCRKGVEHRVAALCVWPRFVAQASGLLGKSPVRLATVVNFPSGDEAPDRVVADIRAALAAGADEIDVVFPWRAFLADDQDAARHLLDAAREASRGAVLKVILESGAFQSQSDLARAARIAVAAGADFLKTSTGKIPEGASPEAVRTLLGVIRDSSRDLGRDVGLKISGGVKDSDTANRYISLVMEIMGTAWIDPAHFRFGASGLLDALLRTTDRPPADPAMPRPSDNRY